MIDPADRIETPDEYTILLSMLLISVVSTCFAQDFHDPSLVIKEIIESFVEDNAMDICGFYEEIFNITNKNIIKYKIEDEMNNLLDMSGAFTQ